MPSSHTELLTRPNVCSLSFMSICYFLCFSFCFRGQDFGSDCTGAWSLPRYFTSRVTNAIGNDVTTEASIDRIVIYNVAAESYSISYHVIL